MSDKTTAWTADELAEFARQRAIRDVDAYERDERGHPIPWRPHAPDRRRWEGHICPEYEHCQLCVEEAADGAAAVAFGLMGMAQAIRETVNRWEADLHDCTCPASWGDDYCNCRGGL